MHSYAKLQAHKIFTYLELLRLGYQSHKLLTRQTTVVPLLLLKSTQFSIPIVKGCFTKIAKEIGIPKLAIIIIRSSHYEINSDI